MSTLKAIVGEARIEQMQFVSTHCANLRLVVEVEPLITKIKAIVTKISESQLGLVAVEVKPDPAVRAQIIDELIALTTATTDESKALKKKTHRASPALHADVVQFDNSLHHILRLMESLKETPSACASQQVTALIAPLNALCDGIRSVQQRAQKEAGVEAVRPYRFWTMGAYVLIGLLILEGICGAFLIKQPWLFEYLPFNDVACWVIFFSSLAACFGCQIMSDRNLHACGYALSVTEAGKLPEHLVKEETLANDTLDLVANGALPAAK